MPLFFIVSGALLKREALEAPWRSFLENTFRALAPGYVTFSIVGFLAWFFVWRRFGSDAAAPDPASHHLLAILYGTGKPEGFSVEPSALWFFPCLFSARLLVYGACRLSRMHGVRAAALSLALSALGMALPRALALPLELDAALVAQGFMLLGFELRRHAVVERIARGSLALVVGLFAVGWACAYYNGEVDMRASAYGNVFLYYGAAIGTSLALLASFFGRRPSRLASAVAANTLVIFPLHILVFTVFAAVYVYVFRWPLSVRQNAFVGLAASVANVALLVALAPLFRTYLPWVYGLKAPAPLALGAIAPEGRS
jgi:acyltransferase